MTEVINLRPSDLTPWPENPRTHSPEQIAQLVGAIQEFGFTAPVLINEDHVILAGHGRSEAAELAGLDEVPCIVLSGLTPAQQRAYVIADNKLSLNAGWDMDKLRAEVEKLNAESFDLDLTGFSDAEFKRMMASAGNGGDGDGDGGGQGYTISYQIIFEDEEQQEVWFAYLRHIKEQYPDEPTLAARLVQHLRELDIGTV